VGNDNSAKKKLEKLRDEIEELNRLNEAQPGNTELVSQIAHLKREIQIFQDLKKESEPEKKQKIQEIFQEMRSRLEEEHAQIDARNQTLRRETLEYLKEQEDLKHQVHALKQEITKLAEPNTLGEQKNPIDEDPLSFSSDRIFGTSVPPAVLFSKWQSAPDFEKNSDSEDVWQSFSSDTDGEES